MTRRDVAGGFIVEQEHLPGRVYVLTGQWSRDSLRVLRAEGAQYLRLNRTLGARFEDLQFLRELTDLRGVEIYDPTVSTQHLAPLLALDRLELLGLQCKFSNVDFAAHFPALRLASFHWRPGCETVFGCRALEFLFMEGYPGKDLVELGSLSRLRRLHVSSRSLSSARGAAQLAALEHVTFAYCPSLADIADLSGCASLQVLEMYHCRRVADISPVSGLRRLRRLHVENGGQIASLQPLLGCDALQEVYLPVTKVADGDMTPLLALPNLRRTAFPRSAAHSHTMAEINRALAERG